MKRLLLIYLLLSVVSFTTTPLLANNFKASAPEVVYMGTPFQLTYTIDVDAKDLQAPDFQVFEILAGPYQSRSSYTQIINGKRSSSTTLTFTFTLMPTKIGKFNIPGAYIVVEGKKITSNDLQIKVEESSNQSQTGTYDGSSSDNSSKSVSNESIFVRTIISKGSVYEQEAVTVTYKLYTLLDVAQFTDIKLPDFNGFLKQDIEQPQNKQLAAESYNGRQYGTVVLYQAVLFPQQTGELKIEPANFTALVRLKNKAQVRSIFDDFFDTYTNIEKKLVAPAMTLRINPLPTEGKPSSFSGVVGSFNMTSDLSSGNLKTNEAGTIKLTIKGSGNMKLLKNPKIKFPDSFEVYDPKVENNFEVKSGNMAGTKTIEYLFIPRRAGKYDIPSAELSYFDLTNRMYRTMRTPAFKLNIVKGEGGELVMENFTGYSDVNELARDIRYIKTAPIKLLKEKRPFFGTFLFWMLYLLPLIIASILFIYLRKRMIENADIAFVKNKKANRIATKRLRKAKKALREDDKKGFYEEIIQTVWKYLSDKLTIPVAELNKENIQAKMQEKAYSDELINKFEKILTDCEYAIYAPNSGQIEMTNVYEESIDAISELENHSRKRR